MPAQKGAGYNNFKIQTQSRLTQCPRLTVLLRALYYSDAVPGLSQARLWIEFGCQRGANRAVLFGKPQFRKTEKQIMTNHHRYIAAACLLLAVACLGAAALMAVRAAEKRRQPDGAAGRAFSESVSKLPPGVAPVLSERMPNKDIAAAVIRYYDIPQDAWPETRYYYNYADLNGDGKNEILAVVVGPYTSGSGGSSALLLLPYAGMAVRQVFTMIHTPIIIAKRADGGASGIVVDRYGGGARLEHVMLICRDGQYDSVDSAAAVEDYGSLEGTAIICDDLAKDLEQNGGLTLSASQ